MAETWTPERIDEIERRVAASAPDLDAMTDAQVWAWLNSLPIEDAAVVIVRASQTEERT